MMRVAAILMLGGLLTPPAWSQTMDHSHMDHRQMNHGAHTAQPAVDPSADPHAGHVMPAAAASMPAAARRHAASDEPVVVVEYCG